MRPPRQSRSEETLERLVAATESLLGRKSFQEATITEIVGEARSSIGAFYTRFPDKDGLIAYLNERWSKETSERWAELLDPKRWKGKSLSELMDALVLWWVRALRRRKGVARSLYLFARTEADPDVLARARGVSDQVLQRFTALVMERKREIRHPHPELAIRVGLLMVVSALRERVFFGDRRLYPLRLSDTALASELSRSFLAYLGCEAYEVSRMRTTTALRGGSCK